MPGLSSNKKLQESILQMCYKSKTYVRNSEWDILWYLGGKNNITIAEKDGEFFLLPNEIIETVTEILPFEIVQGEHRCSEQNPVPISNLDDLKKVYPELDKYVNKNTPLS